MAGGDDEQWGTVFGRGQALDGSGALLRSHAALEDNGIKATLGEYGGEAIDVTGALCEDEAVPTAFQGVDDIGEDLLVACPILGERTMDACDGAGY